MTILYQTQSIKLNLNFVADTNLFKFSNKHKTYSATNFLPLLKKEKKYPLVNV